MTRGARSQNLRSTNIIVKNSATSPTTIFHVSSTPLLAEEPKAKTAKPEDLIDIRSLKKAA